MSRQHMDFLTQPETRTPRCIQSPADYGSPITRYTRRDSGRALDFALAVGLGLMLGLLLGWGF